jgi:hypothetical protein
VFVIAICDRVTTKWDDNNINEFDVPPVVAHEFIKVVSWHFILDVLNVYWPYLDCFWSKEEIDKIEAKQHDLIKWYNNWHTPKLLNRFKCDFEVKTMEE